MIIQAVTMSSQQSISIHAAQLHEIPDNGWKCLRREYKDIIRHCFMDDGHLRFELRKPEAQNLCRLFERTSPGYNPNTPQARPTPTISTQRGAASSSINAPSVPASSSSQPVPGADFVDVRAPAIVGIPKYFGSSSPKQPVRQHCCTEHLSAGTAA